MSTVQRPLVVLFGWLGCQPKFLRRYEAFYQKSGCHVISRIARPYVIVKTVFASNELNIPRSFPRKMTEHPQSVQDEAWRVLAEIDESDAPYVFFHVFSNGGCFVWEQIRQILDLSEDKSPKMDDVPEPVRRALARIRQKTSGVIFDSCPAEKLELIHLAMNYCTFSERLETLTKTGFDYLLLPYRTQLQDTAKMRAKQYMTNLREDPWNLPQLYLYSMDDQLAPYEAIENLVHERQLMHGKDRIFRRVWSKSGHCAHILHHPEEYQTAVTSFVERCMLDPIKSRL